MGTVLDTLARVYSWVTAELERMVNNPDEFFLYSELVELQKLYQKGLSGVEIVEEFIRQHPNIHPELVYLAVDKLAQQNGCLDPADRFLATLF